MPKGGIVTDRGAECYQRFLGGDENAFCEIIGEYKNGLILYLNGYVKNLNLAEDLMEDTFYKLYAHKPRFRPQYSFKTWLYAIGRNVAIDHLRHAGRRGEVSIGDVEDSLRDERDLEGSYLLEERKRSLHAALKRLPLTYRQVLWLLYFEDFSHTEVGKILKKSPRQMKNLVYRAKSALKTELEKDGFVYEE